MSHDLVRRVQAVCAFDQCPARLAARNIPPDGDIIPKIGDDAGGSVVGLDRDGLEEEVHGMDESFLGPRGAFSCEVGSSDRTEDGMVSCVDVQVREVNLFVILPTRVLGSYA